MKTDNPKTLKMQAVISILTLIIGMVVMAFKIYADSEPGAIPLLLVIVGAAWHIMVMIKMRSQGRVE